MRPSHSPYSTRSRPRSYPCSLSPSACASQALPGLRTPSACARPAAGRLRWSAFNRRTGTGATPHLSACHTRASTRAQARTGARGGVHGGKREVVGRTCLGADLNHFTSRLSQYLPAGYYGSIRRGPNAGAACSPTRLAASLLCVEYPDHAARIAAMSATGVPRMLPSVAAPVV